MSGFVAIISICFILPACSFAGTTYLLKEEENPSDNTTTHIDHEKPVIIKQMPYNPHSFDEKDIKSYAIEKQDGGLWF